MSYPHLYTDCHEYHPTVFAAFEERKSRPHTVCICGSMRFFDEMLRVSVDESLRGHIVVLPLVNMKTGDPRWANLADSYQVKRDLDWLHFAKIRLADEVLVVNPGGYIGDSTRNEIHYAVLAGKPVRYLVDPAGPTSDDRVINRVDGEVE